MESEEAEKVKNKITELNQSLHKMENIKEQQRENNRRTVKLEIANLRGKFHNFSLFIISEEMQKLQQGGTVDQTVVEQTKQMAQKMTRLEQALRLLNEQRREQSEDKETLQLKRKLQLFEEKMKQMEEEKRMREEEEKSSSLRDKLLLMEDKLAKVCKFKDST